MTLGTGDGGSAGNAIDLRPILIVTGLVQEARIAAGPGMAVICSSSSPTQLRALLTVVDPESIRGVISFGVAGGLDPTLRSGDVVVATEVLAGDARWAAGLSLSEDLIDKLTSGRRRVVRGSLAGAEEMVTGRSCKAALHSETGAAAVDMESHIAAAYAAQAGLPFAALRVISDPAHRALPALARAAIKPNGQIDVATILFGVVRNPATVRALVSTGIDFNRALRSLRVSRDFLIGSEGPVPETV
ncbi:phosphorylase [Bradyrhizobium sp. CCGUVB23]|uniref:phosphorylase n=1 Tax=Bradyrhizobium sp. CCGUVB23 TaxID=2949630 RepID=UPI0020B3D322|nr:phosphorylase [Bradyrhizobium sp. CCGUVB23]MCP3458845.1 phosphorylase [Bradyrhizobium sp. CCGUVB23]